MQIHSRHAENESRWVWTDGLRMLGQREIAVQVSWPEQDLRDTLLTQLLEFLEGLYHPSTNLYSSGADAFLWLDNTPFCK